jgi:hypothetical protein
MATTTEMVTATAMPTMGEGNSNNSKDGDDGKDDGGGGSSNPSRHKTIN